MVMQTNPLARDIIVVTIKTKMISLSILLYLINTVTVVQYITIPYAMCILKVE